MKLLFLTDHRHHRHFDSVYLLSKWAETLVGVDVYLASLGSTVNTLNATSQHFSFISAVRVDRQQNYASRDKLYDNGARPLNTNDVDWVCLRVLPIRENTLLKIKASFPTAQFINSVDAVLRTESKDYLLNFPELCPDIQLCASLTDVKHFTNNRPAVLKPLYGYGGASNLLITSDTCYEGVKRLTRPELFNLIDERLNSGHRYLAMEFLPAYELGDRRILVVDGEIVGASLRVPQGNWLCNVSSGGNVINTKINEEEYRAADILSAKLKHEGVRMFGIDTLIGNNGKRLVSEINTCCPGGFYSIHTVLKNREIKYKTTQSIKRILTSNE